MKKIIIPELKSKLNLSRDFIPLDLIKKSQLELVEIDSTKFVKHIETNGYNIAAIFLSYEFNNLESEIVIENILATVLDKIPIFIFYDSDDIPRGKSCLSKWCADFLFKGSLIDIKTPNDYISPVLKLIQNNVSSETLAKINNDIDFLTSDVDNSFHVIKQIHSHLMPKRIQNIKGIKIYSKYGVGEANGGDFFDIISNNSNLLLMLSSTNSYLASNAILSIFSELKEKFESTDENLQDFIKKSENELKNMNSEALVNLLLLNIDLKNLQVSGYNFGETTSCGKSNVNIPSNSFKLNSTFTEKAHLLSFFERGDKIVILSSGIKNNLAENKHLKLLKRINSNLNSDSFEILNDIFMDLTESKVNNFYKYDATAIILEVNPNVIIKA